MSIHGEVYSGGATTSQHVDAEDDEHFQSTTFKLKRTRSIGVLDEFIPDKLKQDDDDDDDDTSTVTSSKFTPLLSNNLLASGNNNNNPHLTINTSTSGQYSSSSSTSYSSSEDDTAQQDTLNTTTSTTNHQPLQPPPPQPPLLTIDSQSPSPVASPSPSAILNLQSPELLPHDDTDLTMEPSRHVDYLSYQWDVSDISKSWRYVIQKRKDVANAARLENASWRTWAQRRSNLKTISPEVVNWSKDSDVTWLYGPILKDDDHPYLHHHHHHHHAADDCQLPHHHTRAHSHSQHHPGHSVVAGDISIAKNSQNCEAVVQQQQQPVSVPKPILKKRSVQESMISHSNLLKLQLATNKVYQKQREQLLKQQQEMRQQQELQEKEQQRLQKSKSQDIQIDTPQQNTNPDFDDYDAISAKLNKQYENKTPTDNSSVAKLQTLLNKNRQDIQVSIVKASESDPVLATPESELIESKSPSIREPSPTSLRKVISPLDIDYSQSDQQQSAIDDSSSFVSEESPPIKEGRHIHFNDEVKQCIAVNNYTDDDDQYEDDADYDYANEYYNYVDGDDGYYDDVGAYYSNSYKSSTGGGYDSNNLIYVDDEDNDASDEDAMDEDEDEDEDDEDEGGFFIKVKSNSNAAPLILGPNNNNNNSQQQKESENTEDSESISTSNSKVYKTIQLLPSTTLNYGSSDEESDDDYNYRSSLSHNVNNEISRGYDYYYDYNTVYTVDPNHAIYGINKNPPDVIDVPESLEMGSNFDYIEDVQSDMPIINPQIINSNNPAAVHIVGAGPGGSPIQYTTTTTNVALPESPLIITNPTLPPLPIKQSPFQLSDDDGSDEDSEDEDEGLSIMTRSSSRNLAESVFHQTPIEPKPPSTKQDAMHFPESFEQQQNQPIDAPVLSINPKYSNSAPITKQPTSSNSLSQSFFGGGGAAVTPTTPKTSELSKSFFGLDSQEVASSSTPIEPEVECFKPMPELTRTLSNTSKKASALPPQTTSENAAARSTFLLLDEDSDDSENEDGFGQKSYDRLSQFADKSGIRTPSPFEGSGSNSGSPTVTATNISGGNGGGNESNKNLMGQAKGLAKHFFG
ncbi:REG1 [[Candida] subhashii]|uniref:REG1 n=1 Tax=[Candida] subhashii TaxID=561895 RepID=A0A8J5UNE2_9ASCO|nr:REG1 [[Candida] subhashii]KAG7663766.1 REG1 [[Candida] subhashii]